MKVFAWYALTAALVIAALATAALAFAGIMGRRVVLVSAALALAVQLVTFAVARRFGRDRIMLGWGLGSLLRFAALVLYGVVVARLWRAPVAPALLSFVTFLFVTTMVEPVFLTR